MKPVKGVISVLKPVLSHFRIEPQMVRFPPNAPLPKTSITHKIPASGMAKYHLHKCYSTTLYSLLSAITNMNRVGSLLSKTTAKYLVGTLILFFYRRNTGPVQ